MTANTRTASSDEVYQRLFLAMMVIVVFYVGVLAVTALVAILPALLWYGFGALMVGTFCLIANSAEDSWGRVGGYVAAITTAFFFLFANR